MAYNEELAKRIREQLSAKKGIEEKKMFGGISFLLHGNMVAGVLGDEMIVRFAPKDTTKLLGEPNTRPFDPFDKRPQKVMQGWILVGAPGVKGDSLKKWVGIGSSYAASLPKKPDRKRTAKRR
jgi:TfoX/Sxy family transcriptional regulator of competence genes